MTAARLRGLFLDCPYSEERKQLYLEIVINHETQEVISGSLE
jgi:hypothetical protein